MLEDQRDLAEVTPLIEEVLAQVLQALEVGVGADELRVADEDDAVRPGEHQLARGVEVHLPGHREELQANVHPRTGGSRMGRKSK